MATGPRSDPKARIRLLLQVTLIGWLPAAIWAVVVVNNDNEERRHRELLATLNSSTRR